MRFKTFLEMPVRDNEYFNINTDTKASSKENYYEPDSSHERFKFLDNSFSDFFIVKKTYKKSTTFLVVESSEYKIVAKLVTIEMDGYFKINSVVVDQNFRSKGLAYNLYLTVINKFKGFISDSSLSKTNSKKGSYFLWKKLWDDQNVNVSYMDMSDFDETNQVTIKPLNKFDSIFGKNKGNLRYVATKK